MKDSQTRCAANFSDLINLLGPNVIADRLNCRKKTVLMMKYRNAINASHWSKLIELANEKGLDYVNGDFLLRLKSEKETVNAA